VFDQIKKPRLGDRRGIRIEVTPGAVASYQQTFARAFHAAPIGATSCTRVLTLNEAREELEDVLREGLVTYSASERMTVRCRVRRLEVDVRADLTRLAPDHVRCNLAEVRRLDTRIERNGSRERGDNLSSRDAYRPAGPQGPRRKIGVLHCTKEGTLEYRIVAEENGAPSPPWGPVPEYVRVLALRDEGLAAWLEKYSRAQKRSQ